MHTSSCCCRAWKCFWGKTLLKDKTPILYQSQKIEASPEDRKNGMNMNSGAWFTALSRWQVVVLVGSGLLVFMCGSLNCVFHIIRCHFEESVYQQQHSVRDQIFRLTGGLSCLVWCETQHAAACLIIWFVSNETKHVQFRERIFRQKALLWSQALLASKIDIDLQAHLL